MSQPPFKCKTLVNLSKKKSEIINIDESPIQTTQPSPRANSINVSYFGSTLGTTNSSSGNVKVVCRVRPCNERELELGGAVCVNFDDEKTISVKTTSNNNNENGSGALTFAFDKVYDWDSTQEEIYEFTAKPVVESVLEGFNGTVFAYGQTSSGKTYTMMGPDAEDSELAGIIPRMVSTVFDYISDTPDHIEFTVKVSIVEIYMERIRDLLNPKKVNLKIREDKSKGIYIEDVTESYVSDEKDVYEFLRYGTTNRATTTTNMNETSSRSHCIFMMTIHQNNLLEMSAKTGKLYLVDLAGSEKVGKTGAVGQVLDEAKEINKSLSALGNVINALTDIKGHQHIPYRDSKLTRILQESLGGNARTSLIINCSPSTFNENETISALRFGYRAKSIKNTPKINREFTVAQLQILLDKAEKKIVIKDKRIAALESALNEHGIALSGDFEHQYSEIPSPTAKGSHSQFVKALEDGDEGFDGSSDKEDESCSRMELLSPTKLAKMRQQDRIKALEDELKMERMSVAKQVETIKAFKLDLTEANNRILALEKENEALITKLATQAFKMQDLEEKFRDKEMKLEILQLLKDILMTENEELKKSRKAFLKDLDDENKEIMRLAQTEGLLTPKTKEDQKDKSTRKDSSFSFVDDIGKDMIKDMVQKLNVKNIQILKDLTSPYMDKLKEGFALQSAFAKKSSSFSEGNSEIASKYEKLKEELSFEKQKNGQLKSDYEKVIKEYENLLKNNIPSFEEWKQGIVGDSFRIEESMDNKDDTLIFKDYANKTEQDKKLTLNLDYLKGKVKNRNSDSNMDISQGLETYLAAAQNPDNGEKSPLKTQRMINLEKQLHETKELVNQYKNKIESLKTLITANTSTTQLIKVEESDKLEYSESFRQHKQNIKQEVLNQVAKKTNESEHQGESSPSSSAANAKIIKPIKGGNKNPSSEKKSSAASQKFFDILKQQYRFNRSFMNNLGEGILTKQKQQSTTGLTLGPKTPSEGKTKGV